jgi:hypothetical protein
VKGDIRHAPTKADKIRITITANVQLKKFNDCIPKLHTAKQQKTRLFGAKHSMHVAEYCV